MPSFKTLMQERVKSPLCPPLYRHLVYIGGDILPPSEEDCHKATAMLSCDTSLCKDAMERYRQLLKVEYKEACLVSLALVKDSIPTHDREAMHRNIRLWQSLGIWQYMDISEEDVLEDISSVAQRYPTLPLYTGYFTSFRVDIKPHSTIVLDDNYRAMEVLDLPPADMVYIDPPFATGREFAYSDKYTPVLWTLLMYHRIVLAKKHMRENAVFMLHLDQRADYIGRYLLEEIFPGGFVNEIIWAYYSGGVPRGAYPRKHDSIYIYRVGNVSLKVPLRIKPKFQGQIESLKAKGRLFEDDKGLYVWHNRRRGEKEYVYGPMSDVWTDIPIINNMARERYGFRTQKPEALVARLIDSATKEKDTVWDFFAGSGTTPAVAYKMKRHFVAIEEEKHGGFVYTRGGKTYTGLLGRLLETIAGVGPHIGGGIPYSPYPICIKVFEKM